MNKNLISEIHRIQEVMGVKSKNLLMESVNCPFCTKFLKEIDDLIDLLKKGDLDLAGFTSKIDDLESKIDDMALSINEKQALKTKIQKAKSTGITDGDTFRSLLKQEFDNVDQFGVRQPSALDSADATKIDTVAVMKDPKTAQLSFDSPNTKKEIADLELSFTKPETEKIYKDAFPLGLDEAAEFYVKHFKEILTQRGYPSEFIENYVSIWRNWVKNNETLKKWFSGSNVVVDTTQPQRTVTNPNGGFIIEKLPDDIFEMYKAVIAKNGVDLTDAERKLLLDIEEWRKGKTVDFESYRKPKDEVPDDVPDVVVDKTADGLTEVIAETQAFDLVGLFNKSREEVDIQFLTTLEKMGFAIEVPIIKNAVDAIRKGKKLTSEDISLTKSYLKGAKDPNGSRAFSDNEVAKIVNKLNNPTKGVSLLDSFYWRIIQPLTYQWAALDLKNYYKFLKGNLKTQDLINDFQRSAERALRDFDVNNMGTSLREMRDKFEKIKSTQLGQKLGSYPDIYIKWKQWMKAELRGNYQALKNFEEMCNKMETQGQPVKNTGQPVKDTMNKIIYNIQSLFGSGWGELVAKVAREEGVDVNNVNNVKIDINKLPTSFSQNVWMKVKPVLKAFAPGLVTNFIANTFRTPRDMERFLISKGFSRAVNPLKDAAIVNILQSLAMKFVVLPTAVLGFICIGELIKNFITGSSDIDWYDLVYDVYRGSGGVNTVISMSNELFQDALPEWYKYLSNNGFYQNIVPGFVKSIVFIPAAIEANRKLKSTEENLTNKVKEAKEKGWNEMVEEAKKNWEGKTESEKLDSQTEKSYITIQRWLKETPPLDGKLTPEQAKIILDNLIFEGVPSIPTNRLINFEVIGGTFENIKSGNFKVKPPKLETTGEILVKGASGNKYLLVPVSKNKRFDRYDIYEKTDNPDIKGYYAVIKPKFDSLIEDTNWKYLSLKEFAQQYKNL